MSHSFSCLIKETEKNVDKNNYIVNSAVGKHSGGNDREQEETEQKCNRLRV